MKIAIVTGGSRGLGKNTVLSLAEKGIDSIFTYHSNEQSALEVEELVRQAGAKAKALRLDVSKSETFTAFVSEVKQALKDIWNTELFQFLVNNAGIGINTPYMETTEEQFDTLMNIHLKAPFFLTQKLLPFMEDGGRIVNLSTGLSRFCVPGYSAYATMKGGIEVLTRYMAKELGTRGIVVNVVAPGAIATDFGGGEVRDNVAVNEYLASQTALGRVGLPADIGGVIASLFSEEMGWVNGQRMEASGGMFL